MAEKLVRDKIPEIIRNSGQEPEIRVLTDQEYLKALDDKLVEEVHEYLEANDLVELSDVLEVIHAIANVRGLSYEQIEQKRAEKYNERGGFTKKISLRLGSE